MSRKKTHTLVMSVPFNVVVCVIIIVALLIVMPMQTLPGLTQRTMELLVMAEAVIIGLFTIEFALRVFAGGKKYLLGWGWVEFLAIAPYYLDVIGVIDVDNSELLRIIRLVLLLKLIRPLMNPLRKLWTAFKDVGYEIGVFLIVVLLLVYCAGVVFYGLEHEQNDSISSVYDALWWAIVTLTTLGYGDITPVTVIGKIIASVMIILGVMIVAIPAGLLASELVDQRNKARLNKPRDKA